MVTSRAPSEQGAKSAIQEAHLWLFTYDAKRHKIDSLTGQYKQNIHNENIILSV